MVRFDWRGPSDCQKLEDCDVELEETRKRRARETVSRSRAAIR